MTRTLLAALAIALAACGSPAKERAARPLKRITPAAQAIQAGAAEIGRQAEAAGAEMRGGVAGLDLPTDRARLVESSIERTDRVVELAGGIGQRAAEVVADSAEAREAVAELPPPKRPLLVRILWPWAAWLLAGVLLLAALPQILPVLMGWLWRRGLGLGRKMRTLGKLLREALETDQPEEREKLLREAVAAGRQCPRLDAAYVTAKGKA